MQAQKIVEGFFFDDLEVFPDRFFEGPVHLPLRRCFLFRAVFQHGDVDPGFDLVHLEVVPLCELFDFLLGDVSLGHPKAELLVHPGELFVLFQAYPVLDVFFFQSVAPGQLDDLLLGYEPLAHKDFEVPVDFADFSGLVAGGVRFCGGRLLFAQGRIVHYPADIRDHGNVLLGLQSLFGMVSEPAPLGLFPGDCGFDGFRVGFRGIDRKIEQDIIVFTLHRILHLHDHMLLRSDLGFFEFIAADYGCGVHHYVDFLGIGGFFGRDVKASFLVELVDDLDG